MNMKNTSSPTHNICYNMPFGISRLSNSSYKFNLWAPDASSVSLCFYNNDQISEEYSLNKNNDGWFTLTTNAARCGSLYKFNIDNNLTVPDPASRYQPQDVHGPSQIINPDAFNWEDTANWKGKPWTDSVIYELHIGTFTPEGTFQAIKNKLDYLIDLGVTAIELLPVADFPGNWNWGYDGVLIYAPDSSYGTPDDLKDLIKTCHQKGLMVFLDVVYNHFGPEGNYLYCYAKSKFFSSKHKTPWGDAINFDNKNVRDFFIHNALFWLTEYQFDGLRLDAIHAIKDDSSPNIVEEIATRIKHSFPQDRFVHLILENHGNESRYLQQKDGRAILCDAQWNDDFHHCVHIQLTGEVDSYYADYSVENSPYPVSQHLATSATQGFSYQGQILTNKKTKPRGENCKNLNPYAFINFLQNHDMVGNRAFGERIDQLCSTNALKAALTLFLLTPSIPMLFMGEEWATSSPFLFFCDFGEDLADSVRNGRREEFSKFPQFSNPEIRNTIPDPLSKTTFVSSKLNWNELSTNKNKEIHQLYKSLLEVRKQHIVPLLNNVCGNTSTYKTFNDQVFCAQWPDTVQKKILKVISNLSDSPFPYNDLWPDNLLYCTSPESFESIRTKNIIVPWSVCWFIDDLK